MTAPADTLPLLFLPDAAATEALARRLSPALRPGDVLLLSGDIGAGKSCFARALIRDRLREDIDVPSPTYTLVQEYAAPGVCLVHADLYRLIRPDEVLELDLADRPDAILLVEWPERAGCIWPATRLHLTFAPRDDGRTVHATGHPRLLAALRA